MSTKREALILDMDNRDVKRRLMSKIGALRGPWELTLKPYKQTRSLDQNAYWFAAVVTPFAGWLREEWGEQIEIEQAHEMLKQKILGTRKIDIGGELVSVPPSSRTLDTGEFAELIEKASDWLGKFCNIEVMPSDLFYETAGVKRKSSLKQQLEDSLKLVKGKRK